MTNFFIYLGLGLVLASVLVALIGCLSGMISYRKNAPNMPAKAYYTQYGKKFQKYFYILAAVGFLILGIVFAITLT